MTCERPASSRRFPFCLVRAFKLHIISLDVLCQCRLPFFRYHNSGNSYSNGYPGGKRGYHGGGYHNGGGGYHNPHLHHGGPAGRGEHMMPHHPMGPHGTPVGMMGHHHPGMDTLNAISLELPLFLSRALITLNSMATE